MNLLDVKDLAFAYRTGQDVFTNVNFSMRNGEILTILGPNGIGKSTLLKCLLGELQPSAGQIMLNGQTLANYSHKQVAHQISVVQQNYHLDVDISVRDYLLTARASYLGNFQMPGKAEETLVAQNLKKFQLFDLYDRAFNDLSGGQQQLITIIRAVIQQPQLLLLDEPMASLDLRRQAEVIRLIRRLASNGIAIIMTTHLPDHAFMLGGQIGLFNQEGQLQVGQQDDLMTSANLTQTYGVPVEVTYLPQLHRYTCQLKLH